MNSTETCKDQLKKSQCDPAFATLLKHFGTAYQARQQHGTTSASSAVTRLREGSEAPATSGHASDSIYTGKQAREMDEAWQACLVRSVEGGLRSMFAVDVDAPMQSRYRGLLVDMDECDEAAYQRVLAVIQEVNPKALATAIDKAVQALFVDETQRLMTEAGHATLDSFLADFSEGRVDSPFSPSIGCSASQFWDHHPTQCAAIEGALSKALVDAATSALSKEGK